jgi:hypothetical protein
MKYIFGIKVGGGFQYRQGQEISPPELHRPALGYTEPTILFVPVSFPVDKAAEALSGPLTSTKCRDKNEWSYTSLPLHAFMAWTMATLPFLKY